MKTTGAYTLITGASMGLGKEMAIECARRGRNLILVALPGRNLEQLCQELRYTFGIHAVAIECDMTDEQALYGMVRDILSKYPVDRLINNAGIGGAGRFDETTPEYLDRIIHLNIRATTILTRLMLPELKLHEKACILNVSSVAAFGPLPYKSVYPASKAFIYSFSRSLSRELRGTGVRVTVVAPGPMVTNPEVAMRLISQGAIGRIGLLTPGEISRLALDGAEKGNEVIVPGLVSKLNRFLIWLFPTSWNLSLMDRILRKELTEKAKI